MSGVRPFTENDVDRVVEMRLRLFDPTTEPMERKALSRHFERAFLGEGLAQSPPSLVYEDEAGNVIGFVGVISHRARFQGRTITIGAGTRFMVEPEYRGLPGVLLVKALIDGPQDLTYSDMANLQGKSLMERLGGIVSPVHSMEWSYALRPARQWLASGRGVARYRAVRGMGRPLAGVIDRAISPPTPSVALHSRALEPEEFPDLIEELLQHRQPRPAYTRPEATWLFDLLRMRKTEGEVRSAVLEARTGEPLGWWIYLLNRSWYSTVVHMGWREGSDYEVLCSLLEDAHERGARAVRGKVDAELLPSLKRIGARTDFAGRWTVVHAKQPELSEAVHSGKAFLTKLDGEWPISFL